MIYRKRCAGEHPLAFLPSHTPQQPYTGHAAAGNSALMRATGRVKHGLSGVVIGSRAILDGGQAGSRQVTDMAKRPAKGAGKLTPKQARFVEEYLIDLNATQAAIRAGYSVKTAKQQGQRLLTNVDVAAALSAAQSARSERVRVNADWVLNRLTDEAVADLADILDEAGVVRPVKEWPLIWRQGLVAGIDVQENMVGDVKVGQTVKLRMSDRIKRVEMIGKHVDVQAFRERVDHSNTDGSLRPTRIVIEAVGLDDETDDPPAA